MLVILMDKILLSCKEATRLITLRSYRKLKFRERLQVKMHTTMCHPCRKFGNQSKYIDHAVEHLVKQFHQVSEEELSSEVKSELQKEIEAGLH